MSKARKLFLNSILYFIGNSGKGIAQILVILFASFYISPSEMGIFDLVMATITILQPIIIFQISDGVYRWLLDDNYNKSDVLKTGIYISIVNIAVTDIILFSISLVYHIQNKWMIFLLLNLNCIYPILQQIIRGLKKHTIFAKSGIINSLVLIILTYVFVAKIQYGLKGLYIAQIACNSVCLTYIVYNIRFELIECYRTGVFDKILMKSMLRYSILLVPNSLSQWIMKTLDRYFIMFFLSSYHTGIFSIAHRLPDVLIMLNSVFYASWLEHVIVETSSNKDSSFIIKIYNYYTKIAFSLILVLMPVTKYIIQLIAGSQYHMSYIYVPFLYIGGAFLGLASILGANFLSIRNTRVLLITTFISSVINIIINIIFLRSFGLHVASISFAISYFIMWLLRVKMLNNIIEFKINFIHTIQLLCLSIVYAIIIINFNNFLLDFALECFAVYLLLLYIFRIQDVKALIFKLIEI